MQQFTLAEQQRVNDAVMAAEKETSAEIVPVIASCSGRYDRAEDAWGACFGVALLLFVEFFLYPPLEPPIDWREATLAPILAKLLFLTLGAIVGIVLSSHVPAMRRFFVSQSELTVEVQVRARQIFFDQRVHHTAGRWGVLLYLSLFERRAVILADNRLAELLEPSTVKKWCDRLTEQLRTASPIQALEQVIHEMVNDLADACPATRDQMNERPDALILIGDASDMIESPIVSDSTGNSREVSL